MNTFNKIVDKFLAVFFVGVFICSLIALLFVLVDFKDSYVSYKKESPEAYQKTKDFQRKNINKDKKENNMIYFN